MRRYEYTDSLEYLYGTRRQSVLNVDPPCDLNVTLSCSIQSFEPLKGNINYEGQHAPTKYMSKKLQYEKGGRCGKEDNCKSTLYYEENGFTYCKRGHLQEVNGGQSQLKIEPDGAISRDKPRSKTRMISAPRVEKPASGGKHEKGSPKVGLHLTLLRHLTDSIQFTEAPPLQSSTFNPISSSSGNNATP